MRQGRKPDLSDLDTSRASTSWCYRVRGLDDHDPELDARDTAFEAGGGSRGGIGGVGQLGDNPPLARCPT